MRYFFGQLLDSSQVNLPNKGGNTNIEPLLQIVFGLGGVIALIVIVIAAFQYVVSQGDPGTTAKARNAIIYAFIGLAVCVFAFTIVTFVVNRATT
jgi:hypothetical protein